MNFRRTRAICTQGVAAHHPRRAQPEPGAGAAGHDAAAVRLRAEPGCGPDPDHDLRSGPDAAEPRADPPVQGSRYFEIRRLCVDDYQPTSSAAIDTQPGRCWRW